MKRSHLVPVVLLSKSVVGASTVAFPRFFAALGWPLALGMLLALSAATVASTEAVLGAMHDSRSGSYAGAVKATLEGGGWSDEAAAAEEGGDEGGRGGRGRRSGGLFLSLRRSLPSLALEASGTAFSFGLLCVYNIVVADLAVGGERGSGNGGGGSGGGGGDSSGGGGGGLLCPFPLLGGKGKELFCSRPRFSLLLNALVLVPLSLRPAARDSKVPSAIGIASLLAWTTATMALCFCAWLGGTLSAPSAVPDWAEIAADSGGGEGGRGGSGGTSLGSLSWGGSGASASASAAAAAAGAPPPPPPPPLPPLPPPPPSLLACLVGLARAAGLPTSGLVCQLTAPFIVGEINRQSPREAALIVREAGVLSAAVYALLGIGAGALFGSGEVEANVLSNWRPEALAAAVPWLFGGGGGGEGGIRGRSSSLAAARLLSALVRGAVAASLITMYPLLMFPCRDGALRLWGRLFWIWKEEKSEEEEEEAEQRLLSEEEGREGEGDEDDDDEGAGRRTAAAPAASAAAAAAAASTSHSSSSSPFSHAASTLLLASAAALAALSSGDSASDVLRLTGATAGAVVSYILPAALALASGRRRRGAVVLAAALAAVGAVMIGTAF